MVLMNQLTTKVDSYDKRMNIDKFTQKSLSVQSEEISSYIFLSSLVTNAILDCYKKNFLISQSPSLIALFPLYTLFPFHLYPSRADQMIGVNTCLISTFLKSLCSSCKVENYCSGITSTLMRQES